MRSRCHDAATIAHSNFIQLILAPATKAADVFDTDADFAVREHALSSATVTEDTGDGILRGP